MAISPPSDIVLDAVRAADPVQARAAAERLGRLALTATPETGAFDEVFDALQPGPVGLSPFDAAGALLEMRNRETLATARPLEAGAHAGPYVKFEAFVLQSFVQSMLPSQSDAIYGSGNTGDLWKSLLAEKLAEQLALAGGIGIAARVAAARAVAEASDVPQAAAPGA